MGIIQMRHIGKGRDNLPRNLSSLGAYAFCDCRHITVSSLPSWLRTVPHYAFTGCSSITSFTLHSQVTSIGSYAFSGCTNLASITIPSSVKTIGEGAFINCYALTYLFLDGTQTIEKDIVKNSGVVTLEVNSSLWTTAVDYTFCQCLALENCYINAPNLTNIASKMFYACNSLVSLYLNTPSITAVASDAFPTSLRDLYVPFSQGDVDLSGLSSDITVHYDYAFPATTPGHFLV